MNESRNYDIRQMKPYIIHIVWFLLNEVKEQAKVIYGDRNQGSGCILRRVLIGKVYTVYKHSCQNSLAYTIKIHAFSLYVNFVSL